MEKNRISSSLSFMAPSSNSKAYDMDEINDNQYMPPPNITMMATTVVASIIKPTSVIKFQALPTTRAYATACFSIPFELITVNLRSISASQGSQRPDDRYGESESL